MPKLQPQRRGTGVEVHRDRVPTLHVMIKSQSMKFEGHDAGVITPSAGSDRFRPGGEAVRQPGRGL